MPKSRKKVTNLQCRTKDGGKWYVRKMVDGKVVRISTGQTDKKLAEKVARKILHDLDAKGVEKAIGDVRRGKKMPTYGQYAREFLALVLPNMKAPKTYQNQLAPSIDYWKTWKLDAIETKHCVQMLNDVRRLVWESGKREGQPRFSNNTLRQIRTMSNMLFIQAVNEGLVKANPWKTVLKVAIPKGEPRDRVLTLAEQDTGLAGIDDPHTRRLARLWFGAGLRIGESLKLVPKLHLDFANGRFILDKGLDGKVITKGEKPRKVPMFADARAALIEQLAARGLKADSMEPLFDLTHEHANREIVKSVAETGIPRWTPHDGRRTFCTRMALARTNMKTLQQWMGHSSITITAKFYTHVDDEASMKEAALVADALPVMTNVVDLDAARKTAEGGSTE